MEFAANQTSVKSKNCIGCERFKKDIMFTAIYKKEGQKVGSFVDIFLTTSQAIELRDQINRALDQNQSDM